MERLWLLLILMLALGAPGMLNAEPLDINEVPEPLKPWVDWVMLDHRDQRCPFLYTSADNRRCIWPSRLDLDLAPRQGGFALVVQVYLKSWVTLPGDGDHWPREVTVDGKPTVVLLRDGKPSVELDDGRHEIAGRFLWERIPESLPVADQSGLIGLTVMGKLVPFPRIEGGRLWLRERDTGREKRPEVRDTLDVQVFRHVADDIPLKVTTRLHLDVSGEQREVRVGPVVLPDFIPLSLNSPVPARLESDGRLLLQIRPGRWQIEFTARHPREITSLPLPKIDRPWPEAEIWVFQARSAFRLAEVEGVARVDPRQTNLPPQWQNLPAYRVQAGDAMGLKVIHRGDPQSEPNRLTLNRNLWLDFDGQGYTVNDVISGTMTRDWRLDVNPQMQPGRIGFDGNDQLITQTADTGDVGVEVRRGRVNVNADSRIETAARSLSATGWKQDFQQVSAVLHLPPGWRLLSASGVDNVPDTWLYRWTLLDLFMVMIATLAVARLWHWRWSLLALLTFALIWHEPAAPHYVWLHILAAVALLRVLPPGRFAGFAWFYRNFSLLMLIVIAIPFMVDQVRNGLYPQLELPWRAMAKHPGGEGRAVMDQVSRVAPMVREQAEIMSAPMPSKKTMGLHPDHAAAATEADTLANLMDPKAMVQTGPGLPQWRWKEIPLSWNGPVDAEQTIGLMLMPPAAVLVANCLSVILLLGLSLLMVTGKAFTLRGIFPSLRSLGSGALLLPLALAPVPDARAEFPDPSLLKELKIRLLTPPRCLPSCAQIGRMQMAITPTVLRLQLEVDTAERVALPLPGQAGHWAPSQVIVDGAETGALQRTGRNVWVALEAGKHRVVATGPLPDRSDIMLPLPLSPRWVEVKAEGWTVEGIGENGVPEAQLRLSRVHEAGTAPERPLEPLEAQTLPPFLQVERTLRFGLDWHVSTRVVRASPPGTPVLLEVPLLEGESVTTAGLRVERGNVRVNMLPGTRMVVWDSVLEKRAEIVLMAAQTDKWSEVWRADVSPMWHLESEGIAVVHHGGDHWLPEWRPWPGEQLKLRITRPEGIEGRTLTVDESRLLVKPGKRSTDASLELTVRSSQGGQHTLTLPAGSELQSVTIDGQMQPIRQSGDQVTLPINPARQSIRLNWHEGESLTPWYRVAEADLGTDSVNSRTTLTLEKDRWVLFLGGPDLGPAVLFWGVLIVIALLAAGLDFIPFTPLKGWHWFLLLVGLSQIPVAASLVIVAWLILLGMRGRLGPAGLTAIKFNLMQVGLGFITVVSLVLLFTAIKQGLLGTPDMQIAGNQSDAYTLNWYQDRNAGSLPRPWIVSVPLIAYQLLMLAWSLWLAYALLGWLKWGWHCYSSNGLWRRETKKQAVEEKHEEKSNP